MKLSIIIPCYNNEKTIMKTIKSIYASNNINKYKFEIIVVDDGSVDASHNLVKKNFPTVNLHKIKHSGAAKARNIGIKKAKGKLLLFIDGDAWFNKSTIHTLVKDMDTDIVFPKINYEDGKLMYPVFDFEKTYPGITTCFLTKSRIKFDEIYETYLEDYDYFIRCKRHGLTAKYIDNARVIHGNKLETDFSHRYYLEVRNLLYGRRKLGAVEPFTYTNLIKALVFGIFNFAWFNWYGYYRQHKDIKQLFSNNKITDNPLRLILLYFKAIKHGLKRN